MTLHTPSYPTKYISLNFFSFFFPWTVSTTSIIVLQNITLIDFTPPKTCSNTTFQTRHIHRLIVEGPVADRKGEVLVSIHCPKGIVDLCMLKPRIVGTQELPKGKLGDTVDGKKPAPPGI